MLGKSSIACEMYKVLAKRDGIFIKGKFDLNKIEPFSAVLEALTNFCDDLSLQDQTTISKYRYQIQNTLDEEGIAVLSNVIDNLHFITGEEKQQAINSDDSFGKEAKILFANSIIKFIQAICSVGPPIILLLDDLQWLDSESAYVLSALFKDTSTKNLMFIGTYRSDNYQQLESLIRLGQEDHITTTLIDLENLDHEAVRELISNTLNLSYQDTYTLTAFVHKKTKGNPYFVKQILSHLYEERLIYYCNDDLKWKLSSSLFHDNENITENILELFRQKILSLSEYGQQALKVAR